MLGTTTVHTVYETLTGVNSGPSLTPRGEAAYRLLRKMIIDQAFDPGQKISEAELVRRVGLSRTPVREALQRLETAGYVVPASGRGYIVVELSEADINHAYQVRAVLEGLAAHLATITITRAALGNLEDLYEAMEEARNKGDDVRLGTLNSRFHHSIAQATGNQYLTSMLGDLYDVFERYRPVALRQPGRRNTAAEEHGEIIRALQARDATMARRLAEEHVEHALSTRMAALKESGR